MKDLAKGNLHLGSNVVELLRPQRRPFLMVDFVRSFRPEPVPTLEAGRHISANEGFFDGHFPGLHVWPGALTIEGVGQSGVLLVTLLTIWRAARAGGRDPEEALQDLRNLDAGFRLQPGYRPEAGEELLAKFRSVRPWIAVGTSVEMKFLRPIFAGQRLDYRVMLTGEHEGAIRFEGEASLEGMTVASGVLMGMMASPPISPQQRL